MRKPVRILLIGLVALLGLLSIALVVSAINNRRLPRASADPGRLSAAEQARLAEYFHLVEALGDDVWPGFGSAAIPVVLYNEEMVFLAGPADPAPGWQPMPDGRPTNEPWRPLEAAGLDRPVYGQPLPASGETPQSFAVRTGDRWAASLATMEWMRVSLAEEIRADLPPFIAAVFPYSLFLDQLVAGSEQFISLIAHEAFHAYQGQIAPDRLAAAEAALRDEAGYPWDETAGAWQQELDTLAAALKAPSDEEAARLAADFLAAREQRRTAARLTPDQIALEQQREWLEGLARYVELAVWREASADAGYRPVAGLDADPDFGGYGAYNSRWQRELDQMGRVSDDPGETRFYYSGMGIAMLLDRLAPGWKARVLEPGVMPEDLLVEALDAS